MARKTAKERSDHKRGLVRVIGFLTVVGLVSAGFSVRAARAELGNKSLMVGREMTKLADSAANSHRTEVFKVVLNGQPVFAASTVTDDSTKAVLDRYRQHCDENRAQATEIWKQLADANAKEKKVDDDAPAVKMAESGGTLRGGNDEEGSVLCFIKAPESKSTLKEGLQTLSETGELNAIGYLRYAYAKKTKNGRTHVLAAWTNDKFNIKEFAPDGERDVQGHDFDGIPRPADSTRIFSIHLEGMPYGVNVYQSKSGTPAETIGAMDKKMISEGWFSLDIESRPKRNNDALKDATGRLYERDGAVLTVVSKVNDGSTVTALGMSGNNEREPLPKSAQRLNQ